MCPDTIPTPASRSTTPYDQPPPDSARVRLTATLPFALANQLLHVGAGSATRGLIVALKALEKSPEWQELLTSKIMKAKGRKWATLSTATPVQRAQSREIRDAMIYYECAARVFTRAAIAQRYGLSLPRVDQIFAEQRRNPPPMPDAQALRTLQEQNPSVLIDPLIDADADVLEAPITSITTQHRNDSVRAKTNHLLNDWNEE